MDSFLELLTDRVKSFYEINETSHVRVEKVKARDLLVPERYDLVYKLFYIDSYVRKLNMAYPRLVYEKHINSITAFTNKENGQADKNDIDSFINTFDDLIDSFQCRGFDDNISLIPITKDNILLDGAHRVACAIYFDIPIKVVRVLHVGRNQRLKPAIFDYCYFKKYLLGDSLLDLGAQLYLKYSDKNIYLACMWPAASGGANREKAFNEINQYPVIYSKDVKLSYRGLERLVSQVYMNDFWVGSVDNGFAGTKEKATLCYKENSKCSFVLFEGKSKEDTLQLKDRIRKIFNIDKHSIHITDSKDESIKIAKCVFNSNTIDFYERANLIKNRRTLPSILKNTNVKIYGLYASKLLWGIVAAPKESVAPLSINEADLTDEYNLNDVENMPFCYFTYIDKTFLYPSEDVVKLLLKEKNINNLIHSENKGVKNIFDNAKYNYNRNKLIIRNYLSKIKAIIRTKILIR